MKKNTHPDYHFVTIKMTDGTEFKIRSTYGKEGDIIKLTIDSLTHPAYTGGNQYISDTGRVSKFNKKYKKFINKREENMGETLMPKSTAVWLLDNTILTFEQIAHFCNMHVLEIKAIADGHIAASINGLDPVLSNQLTREEIKRCEQDPNTRLTPLPEKTKIHKKQRSKEPRYIPIAKRQDRPSAIEWILRNHPKITDKQICKLIATTKNMIDSIRNRSYWNYNNIKPVDPVLLGLCNQIELDNLIKEASLKNEDNTTNEDNTIK